MGSEQKGRFSAREKADCLSILMFWWLRKLVYIGLKRELTEEDVYPVLYSDHSAVLGSKLENNWIIHLEKCARNKKRPSFRWVLWLTFGKKFLFCGMFSMIEECVFRMLQVISLGYLIKYFSPEHSKLYTKSMAELACGGIILGSFCFCISFHWSLFNTHHVCTHMRISISSLIYRKTLRLSQATMRSFSVGQLVTLLSSDVYRFDMQDLHLNYIWIAPLQLSVVIYLMYFYYDFGAASLGGLILLVIFVIFQYIMSKYVSRVRKLKIMATNQRMRLITEIMNAYYNIKVYGWENLFYAHAKDSRRKELRHIRKTMILRILTTSFSLILTKITVFLTLLFYIYYDNRGLDAERVFIPLLLYEHVRVNLAMLFTRGATDFAECSVTAQRMTEFLLLEEKYAAPEFYEIIDSPIESSDEMYSILSSTGVHLKNVSCKWHYNQTNFTLQSINLEVNAGRLIAIVGPTGSGKSSLLSAILGELPTVGGKITIQGQIAYVPQNPWLFPGTVRQNIIFGKMYNKEWYEEVLEICDLKNEINDLELGDNTRVLRAGLSVGQRARISMARAVYSNSDIYLMDDPLNCVDTRLQRHILESCIRGALRKKAVVLVTHQIHFLEEADDIAIIIDGKLRAEGTYHELQKLGIHFTKEIEDDGEKIEVEPDNDDDNIMERRKNSFLIIEGELETNTLIVKEHLQMTGADYDIGTHSARDNRFATLGKSTITIKEIEDDSDKTITVDKIGLQLFWAYVRVSSSMWSIIIFILLCFICQALFTMSDYWLEHWTSQEEHRTEHLGDEISEEDQKERNLDIIVYCCLIPGLLILTLARSFAMYRICIDASLQLFCQLLGSLLHAKARFFDATNYGNGINRFSKDMIIVDELLPSTLHEITGVFFEILGAIVILGITNVWSIVPSVLFLTAVVLLYKIYRKTATTLRRFESNARSPSFAHTSKTLDGLTTIRAFGQERIFQKIFDDLQDNHTAAWFLYVSMHSWLSLSVDFLSLFLVASVPILFVFGEKILNERPAPAEVGLAVAKVIELSILLQTLARELADSETEMISVERILVYSKEQGEGPWVKKDTKPPPFWPRYGQVTFKNVSVEGIGNKILLRNINCEIEPGEKIGIVGRSGSGKSTLINTLFRITEPSRGRIFVDGVNIQTLGLHDLRKHLSIIPQEPHIFAGSLRMNLDPFDEYPDHEIWSVLDEVNLFDTVKAMESGLDTEFSESGWQFSAGQAQLISLARCILQKDKIICLDEATANLDNKTQSIILKKIRENFSNSTVLKVAHRLQTVMDSDKIMVIENGEIVDFGEPYQLIREEGPLYHFIMHMGRKNAEEIIAKAKDQYIRRRILKRSFVTME